jgi:hypothetical protein
MFASKRISLPVKFTTLLARPFVLRGKLCLRVFRIVKNNTWNLKRTLIFSSEKAKKKCVLNSK